MKNSMTAICGVLLLVLVGCDESASHLDTSANPVSMGSNFVRIDDCKALPAPISSSCHESLNTGREEFSVARIDVNGDGMEDFVTRRSGTLQCGSGGCSTDIYIARGGDFVRSARPLVTTGPVIICDSQIGRGITFPESGPSAACFAFNGFD